MIERRTHTRSELRYLTERLRCLGAVSYDLWLPESHILLDVLHPEESMSGIVYGHYIQENNHQMGRGALIATNQRVLLLDKKPLFSKCDELTYGIISAVTYSKAGIAGTVTLHTRMGDISVRTYNETCATVFVEAIEASIFKAAKTNI